jgi:hypothetical protein
MMIILHEFLHHSSLTRLSVLEKLFAAIVITDLHNIMKLKQQNKNKKNKSKQEGSE